MNSSYAEGTLYQRDQSRTQLFGSRDNVNSDPPSSAYDTKSTMDYSQSRLAQLESQSEEHMGLMNQKVKALKSLSLRMGDEIRGSNQTLTNLGHTFEGTTAKLKNTFTNMMTMAGKSRITIKMWLAIFSIVGLLFFWVWVH
ncbi:Bet1p KNAG_0E03570 [Huiozyma naganishii CBS 8797]|uniref:t-SNARE coiled-coil homology domain-containing protein n=1 Tax=Huiozyma naganishii (strain ATCC MYA-139 / BCRC 22969 / CBS 8797 / KCTC 17520 / NBRC 10181 / NCYC 3082 / Yp74L-3) TaxID=1071383 RepID=J7S6V9_HUIN7|nr:hypothetical protein KNAG_0E03570 [Kazachstania naganishii CBS 8797]CCK70614.1 hypothetical protein KNAG_0E03570 [Kazachstania naganishii CBS 8797]